MDRESLWDFAVRTYARPGVAALCLTLQDEHGLDVDVVLACLWVAAQGRSIDDAVLEAMLRAAAPAREHVQQIRALRRAIGAARADDPDWQASYEHLKAAELAGERVELARIHAELSALDEPSPGDHPAARPLARLAVRRYARAIGVNSGDALLDSLVDRALEPDPGDR